MSTKINLCDFSHSEEVIKDLKYKKQTSVRPNDDRRALPHDSHAIKRISVRLTPWAISTAFYFSDSVKLKGGVSGYLCRGGPYDLHWL